MGRKMSIVKTGIVWAVLSFLAGCTQLREPVISVSEPTIVSQQPAVQIAMLEAIVFHNPDSPKSWQAHYRLAQLYYSYKNPYRNYQKSLEHLELYLPHQEDAVPDHDLQNWLLVLREIQNQSPTIESQNRQIEQLAGRLEDFTKTNLFVEGLNSTLEEENAELTMKVEVLKTLDQSVEEKRKNYTAE
jgi:hypothetical protein